MNLHYLFNPLFRYSINQFVLFSNFHPMAKKIIKFISNRVFGVNIFTSKRNTKQKILQPKPDNLSQQWKKNASTKNHPTRFFFYIFNSLMCMWSIIKSRFDKVLKLIKAFLNPSDAEQFWKKRKREKAASGKVKARLIKKPYHKNPASYNFSKLLSANVNVSR
jgi:hypothetical protein